jgi:hypothetical protein
MAAVSFPEEGQLQAVEELNGFRFTNRYWLLEALQAAGLSIAMGIRSSPS